MRIKPRLLKRWQFSASVFAPAVLLLAITAAAVVGFVLWSTADVDRRSLLRQTELVRNILAEEVAKVPRAQESIAIWDDAIERTKFKFDKDWIDNNLGIWMYEYYGHDHVVVFDQDDEPIYTMSDGVSPETTLFASERSLLTREVAAMRALIASGALQTYVNGETAKLPQVVDLRQIGGRPAVVSIAPIVSDTGDIAQEPGSEYLHLAISYLDEEIAAGLGKRYMLEEAAFATERIPSSDHASYPLASKAGRFVTFFQWKPDKPGQVLLAQTAPVLAGTFLVASLLIVALVDRLWKSSAALEAERMSAHHQATHDALTGLPNRTRFERKLEEVLASCTRDGTQVALLMLDLDRFKKINDTLGHQAGDDLIRAVGQRLQELLGNGALSARLGGDEFAIIYSGKAAMNTAADLARRAIVAASTPFVVAGSEVFIGTSIGIAVVLDGDADRLEVTRKADIALYEAKSTGRNRAVFYEDVMYELLQSRHTIEAELREALRGGDQLAVAFQPLFHCRTGTISGAEALVRWSNPRLGQVSPAHFIPVAESTGLVEGVGDFVLRGACELGARWPGLTVAVNISPAQLRNPKFSGRVFDILEESGMRPDDLELEITESILLEDEDVASAALREFRRAGIKIALDDFGTGYSSLNYLKRYPVDRIKIDRSFVSQLARQSASSAIVQAMVTLAHALGIAVTAEGVETHEQVDILREMGCNTLQGFLLATPTTPALIEAMFRDQVAAPESEARLVAEFA
ncbi:MAG: EAL domain-containing protein [Devosia sp.]|nr:EAL domain-containing protein [Devosia sp.]